MSELNLKKQENENNEQFIWRLCQYKDVGMLDMSWDDIADIINKELGMEDTPFSEAAFRKPYQQAKRFYDAGVFNDMNSDRYIEELKLQKQELEKEKVRMRDERNELKRMLREEARKESYRDQITRAILECDVKPLEYNKYREFNGIVNGDNDLVVTFFDVHAGLHVDNYFNTFNEDVLKQRINKYLDKVLEVQARHGSENACVILSELLSGVIHPTIRIENNQNLIEQFLTVTNYISEFLEELSYHFNSVGVFCCPGNHSRITPNKDDSLRGENMDLLAIPYLQAKMQNFKNVHFYENEIDKMIAMFVIRGQRVFAVHGDKTRLDNVVEKLTMYVGVKPDIIYTGHMHTNAMVTSYNVKVVQAGTFAGSGDEYTMNKMLRGNPEQVISVISDKGLECNYDVTLN